MNLRTTAPSLLIIGGGFAGASLAIRLLDRSEGPLSLTIVDPRADLGRGQAYSAAETAHLVNGPAEMFSLHPDDPEHLARWVRRSGAEPGWTPPKGPLSDVFLPRRVYGRYVGAELERAVRQARGRVGLTHLRAEVVRLARGPGGLGAELSDGRHLSADGAILATGVFPLGQDAALTSLTGDPRLITPWDPLGYDRLASADDVLIVGASLSMVDAVASLDARGFKGRYHVISRRGHLIEPRRPADPRPDFLDPDALPRTARGLLAAVIRERRAISAEGADWQTLPAALRPHILPLWQGATTEERLRFVRHLRPLWDVTAHRASPVSFTPVDRARGEGRFTAKAARLVRAQASDGRIGVTLRRRGVRIEETVTVDGIVDARGHQEHDWRRIDAPLVRALLADGLVRPHATGFGIDATREGAVIGADGGVAEDLHALGHPLRGVAWESSSIPEQIAQGSHLADRLLARLVVPA